VGTDTYRAIEVHDLAGALSNHEAPWVRCLDLYPLYPGGDYSPLGCLSGIRNWNGWEPVAEGRGQPADVAEAVRKDYEYDAEIDPAVGGSTWISWPQLRDLDMTVTPLARCVLEANENGSSPYRYYRIEDEWSADIVADYGSAPNRRVAGRRGIRQLAIRHRHTHVQEGDPQRRALPTAPPYTQPPALNADAA